MNPWQEQELLFGETVVAISCNGCRGRGWKRANVSLYQGGRLVQPVFEEGVVVRDIQANGVYSRYAYDVPCGACASFGLLSPIPDAEIFRAKRKRMGILRQESA